MRFFFGKQVDIPRYQVVVSIICFFITCSKFEQDNPFDTSGTNWHPPTVSITADSAVWLGKTVRLQAEATDTDGSITRYKWNIDGTIVDSVEPSYDASFTSTGIKNISVIAYDNNNVPSARHQIAVTVRDTIPMLSISAIVVSFGTSSSSQTFPISNTGYGTMAWSVTNSPVWLNVSPRNSTVSAGADSMVTISVNRGYLSGGTNSGTLVITAGNQTKNITVLATGIEEIKIITVTITNTLILPVTIYANDDYVMTIPAESSKKDTVWPESSMEISWNLVRDLVDGYYQGEALSSSFAKVSNPSGNYTYEIDHLIGSEIYFAPIITNKTSINIIAGVNWGLNDEFRCDGYLPANSKPIRLGYFRLWSNTRIVIFRNGSNFTGNYLYWEYGDHFTSSSIDEKSGRVDLTTNSAP